MTTATNNSQNLTQEATATTIQVKQEAAPMKEQVKVGNEATLKTINIDQLVTPGYHPRSSKVDIDSLANSIINEGILAPLTVMRDGNSDKYLILDGSRRKEALEQLGELTALCIIKSSTEDADAAHTSYVINMERKTLNPIEQALHIKKMKDDFGYSHNDLSIKGYGTPALISKKLKVLDLSEAIQKHIIQGKLTEAHGRVLLRLNTANEQKNMAKEAIKSECSAVKLEKMVTRYLEKGTKKKSEKVAISNVPDTDIEGVYFKDSRDMSEFANESVHLVMTTPPNGTGIESKDYSFDTLFEETKEVFTECARVLVPGGVMVIDFADIQDITKKKGNVEHQEWLFTGPLIQAALRKHNVFLTDVIQYVEPVDQEQPDDVKHTAYRPTKQVKQLLILRKKGERQMPNDEVVNNSSLSKEEQAAWCVNMWEMGQGSEELSNRIIKMFSFEGDTVLNPWLGDGTTLKVARDLKRTGVGYERNLECKPAIIATLGLMPEGNAKPRTEMQAYAEKSLAESEDFSHDTVKADSAGSQYPEMTFITNMPMAEMALAYQNYSPEVPAS